MKNTAACKLIIDTGTTHPGIVTETTGVAATKELVKGQARINSSGEEVPGVFYDENIWIYSTDYFELNEGEYVNHPVAVLLDTIHKKQGSFQKIFTAYPKYYLTCYGYLYDFHHYMFLNTNIITRLSLYKLEIEFDFYYLPPGNNNKQG